MADLVVDTERLRRLQTLTDEAFAHLELEDLLAALVVHTRDLLEVDTSAVLLLADDRRLVARAAVGLGAGFERAAPVAVGEGFAGRVVAERRPVIVGDAEATGVADALTHGRGVTSLLGVPLVKRDRPIGVLQVGTLAPRSFAIEDVELLQLVADRAAVGIEHARLYDSERTARRRLEGVQAVTDIALAHLGLDDLLAVLLPRIREILDAETCAVLLLDPERNELVARAAVGLEEEVERGVRIPVGRGFAGRVAAGVRPVVLDDVDHADILNPLLREKGVKSLLGVPLVVRGEVIGVVHVGTLTHRVFGAHEVELLELVAERVALAIERARLHEEVVLLDQLKLNFVAVASHELRTPATSVYGVLATLVERGDQLSAKTREKLLHAGYEHGERLRRLIEQLLDLSRLDARSLAVDPKPLVLHSVLSEIADSAVPDGTPLTMDVAPDVAVVADPLVLERVLSNLLLNALRHGEPPIVVTAEQRDRHLRIAVEDHGRGIPKALQPQLFERFTRGGDTRGSGLGLAIARAYAQAHGGDLIYAARDRGARFELIIPRSG